MKESCSMCKYFHIPDGANKNNQHPFPGNCLRHAPMIIPQQNNFFGSWPLVMEHTWCGDFQLKREDK